MQKQQLSCLVIMPFGEGQAAEVHWDRFVAFIQPAVQQFNVDSPHFELELERADDPQNLGRVSQRVIVALQESDIVIADLAGLNPNVMYELGIRHTTRHGTIILVPEHTAVPFDIAGLYVIRYADRPKAIKLLTQKLAVVAREVTSGDSHGDSPVLHDGLKIDESLPRVKLSHTARQLGEEIAKYLSTHSEWAAESVDHFRSGWISRPVFDERLQHFRSEKDFLAKSFTDFLWSRVQGILREGYPRKRPDGRKKHPKVYVLIDSGTTLIPVFRHLATLALAAHRANDPALGRIEIVTNNLAGLSQFVEHARPEPDKRYSVPVLTCQLLPGIPMPVYSAVAGDITDKALKVLRDQEPDAIFIGVLTGNWIRIRREGAPGPVAMARGESHRKFKQALLDVCHEAYVLAPLGKVFQNQSQEAINEALDFRADHPDPERHPYSEVQFGDNKRSADERAKTIKLVSTSRPPNCLLHEHGIKVMGLLDAKDSETAKHHVQRVIEEIPHIMDVFDDIPNVRNNEMRMEFPHEHTRRSSDFLRMFGVKPAPVTAQKPGKRSRPPPPRASSDG